MNNKKRKTIFVSPEQTDSIDINELDTLQRTEKIGWGFILGTHIMNINKLSIRASLGGEFERMYISAVKQFYYLMASDFTTEFNEKMTSLNLRYKEQFEDNAKKYGNQKNIDYYFVNQKVYDYRYWMEVFRYLMELADKKGLKGSLDR